MNGQRTNSPATPRRLAPPATRPRSARPAWLLGPAIVVLCIVIGYPLVTAVIQSFNADPGIDPATGMFVDGGFAGVRNFSNWLFQRCGNISCPPGSLGASFWTATGNTFFFTVVTVALETIAGIWMAVIMNRTFWGRGVVRASILVPWAIPTAVTAKLWFFIFSFSGIANAMLGTQILWTADSFWAKVAIIIADVWKTTPFMALLILAGLQIIPAELYEAARVDGASTRAQFFTITLPLIRPALMVAILFRTLDALRMYDLPAILTGGGPGNATSTLSILVVGQIRQGFNAAAALSTITFLIIFAVAFVFVRFLGASIVSGSIRTEPKRGAR